MTLSVSSFSNQQFERQNQLRDTAKFILNRSKASQKEVQSILQKTIFASNVGELYTNAQLNTLKASVQISLNNTKKYLRKNENKLIKIPKLGELINLFEDGSENFEYDGELKDFQIDENLKNIFAA